MYLFLPSLQLLPLFVTFVAGFVDTAPQTWQHPRGTTRSTTALAEMKRPLLDQLASTLFQLETARVKASTEVDELGREGEPMEWSQANSLANRFSQVMADYGYGFKQFVADLVAGDYDPQEVQEVVDRFVADNSVAVFSFTTCPFCRRAKDYLDTEGIAYAALELDELPGNKGNEIRAALGRLTRRTSVPSIFINGKYIGGCNDGPGLLPLAETGELEKLLARR
jgi:glutaredoxin 3